MDIPWREVLQSLQKKPRSVNHSQFVRLLPLVIQQFVLARDAGGAPNEIKLRLGWLSEWLTCYRLDEITQALEKEWLADGHTDAFCDRMIHRLYIIRNPQKTLPEVLPTARELPAAVQYTPNLSSYDRLHGQLGGKMV